MIGSWRPPILFFISSKPESLGVGGGVCDRLCWDLNGSGKFDARSFYHKIRNATHSTFPWKGIWKVKVPKRVAFFMWTAAHGQILTLNNLMLRGRPMVNRCYLCCCDAESVDHLLLSCLITHSLWMHMLRLFGIDWEIGRASCRERVSPYV